ncbi:MAG: PKD domain-containing protein [Bacteroidetes bacterium]|nr:PKD domain-containing protein [Bacteroidota bacterium]
MVTAMPSAPSICQGYRSQLDVVASTPVGPYCIPSISSTFLHYLGSFYLTDTTNTTTYVSTTRNSAAGTPNNYVDHGVAATTGTLAADSAYNFNGTYSGAYEGLAIWIDFNQNGIFDNSELLYAHYAGNATSGVPYSGRFTIPSTALSGVTKMRVRIGWGSDTIPDANGLYSCTHGNSDGFSTYGSTDDYTITITGGVTPSGLSYAWSPSGTLDSATIHNPVATPTATTGYTVTVTDPNTGCSATMTDTVYVNAPTPLTATISGPTGTVCGATPYTLTTTAVGGCTPYVYAWSEGTGTLTASLDSILPTATTTYTVTVTDSSGNQATATFTLNVSNPLVTATTGASLCGPGAATLVATPSAGGTIVWYDSLTNGTLVYTGDTFTTQSISSDVTYYAFATTSSPTCSSAGTAVVAAVHSNPALTLNYSIVHVCATGEQLAITSTLPAHGSYTWSPVSGLYTDTTAATPYAGGNAASVYGMPGATTAYTVTLYDSTTGCSSQQTDSFIVYQRPTATLSGTDTTVCPGAILSGTISFTGTGPWTFIRTTDHGAPVSATVTTSPYAFSDTPTVSGPIKITVLTDQHCIAKYSDLDSFNVTVMPVSASFTPSLTTAHTGDVVTFTDHSTGATSYAWTFGDGGTSTAQSPTHTYDSIGIYTVSLTVTNSLGCTSTTTRQDTVIWPLAISDIPTDNSMLKIFSFENKVMVDFSQYKTVQATIRIYNVIGQELSNETHNAPTTYVKAVPGAEIAYVIVSVKMSDGSISTKKVLITN